MSINFNHVTNDITASSGSVTINGSVPSSGGGAITISNKTAAYTVVAADAGTIINCTGTYTVSLTAAATLGSGFNCQIWNSNTGGGNITIDPSGSEAIPFGTTYILGPGQMATIICTGTKFNVIAGTISNYIGSVQIGQGALINNGPSIAIGYTTAAYGGGSTAIGYAAAANNDYALAIGRGATAGTRNTTAIGQNSATNGSVTAGTDSAATALGGSYASGIDSFAAAIGNNTSSYGATGSYSIALGSSSKATGGWSVAIGWSQTASGSQAVCLGGNSSIASGNNSLSIGRINQSTADYSATIGNNNIASAAAAIAFGDGATSSIIGKFSYTGNARATSGLSQTGIVVLSRDTTDATATALTSNTGNASTNNQVILPNNSAYAFSALIVARQQAAGGTASAAWKVEGLIRREGSAGATTLVNSAITVLSNVPGWTLAVSADTTNGGLAITATGAAATNIRWVATVNTSEVTYA